MNFNTFGVTMNWLFQLFGLIGTREKGPRKNGPQKNGPLEKNPRKNVLKKLFSVKKMLGNLNHFHIIIDWFHYTHKNMFDVHLTILHAPNCRTLKKPRKAYCRVLGFHRLITSQHYTHPHRCARCSPHDILFPSYGFVVEFWVFIEWSPILKLQVHKYCKILIW